MKTKIYYLLFIILLYSCAKDNPTEQNRPTPIAFIEIGAGSVYGCGFTQSDLVIDNQTDWQNLISQMDTYNNNSGSFSQTNIDFNTDMLLVVILDEKCTLWGVSFESVIEDSNNITATTSVTTSDATAMSQPFCIVKIPKSNKQIIFIHN